MSYLNKILLIGNLTKDVELGYIESGSGLSSVRFEIAIYPDYPNYPKSNDEYQEYQEYQEEVCFCYIDVVAFGDLAKDCAKYLSKGSMIFIEGRLNLSQLNLANLDLEVVAQKVEFSFHPFRIKGRGAI